MTRDTTGQRTTAAGRHARAVGRWLSAHRALVGAAVTVVLAGLTALAGCGGGRRAGGAADDRTEMARAERIVDSLEQRAWMDEVPGRPHPALDDSGLVALGYVARARLGVGSPFRLAAFAARDPRLPAPLGRTIAWAVLARTTRGAVYAADTTALAFAAPTLPAGRQLTLIDAAIDAAPDARSGEEAVRIGYALGEAEGLVGGGTAPVASRLAALARDRRLSREDAARLLQASSVDRTVDALTLLLRWRGERRFLVEQPLLGDVLRPDPAAAVRLGIALRDSLRAVARTAESVAAINREADSTRRAVPTAGAPRVLADVLPPRAARRLADLPSVRNAPPQAPVAVATAAYRRQLLHTTAPATEPYGGRRRFADRARSEETLVAELAIAGEAADGTPMPGDVARVALAATVAMRAFAQDTLLPAALARGIGAISADAVAAQFRLRSVTFDASVPAAWRPYHLAQLVGALEELQGVLPGVEFGGLAVRVGESVKRDSALALHDPTTRTLFLPAATGAGTIAHELAHDLDWQTARTRLAVRGTYSTDRAIRDGRGALAVSVRGLTAARPGGGRATARDASAERPAELFARGVDWFVASALAAGGRTNGALSAVQDETLVGYAGVQPPVAGDGAADALVGVLGDMTIVPAATRSWFLARYGAEGTAAPAPLALVRATAGAMARGGAERLLRTVGLVGPACVGAPVAGSWQVAVVRAAAESRARGVLVSRARRWAAPARWSWEARAATGGPWNPALGDSAIARVRDGVLRAAAWEDAERHPFGGAVLAGLAAEARGCR